MPWTLTFNHRPFQLEPQGSPRQLSTRGSEPKRAAAWKLGEKSEITQDQGGMEGSEKSPAPLSPPCLAEEGTESGETLGE